MSENITITKIFNAPLEKVWNAWTDPKEVAKWWGPEGFTAPSIKIDFRVGGKYIYAMRGPKGSEWDRDMYSAGVYKEIVPNEKLVVTDYFSDADGNMIEPKEEGQDPSFPKESVVTVLFEEVQGGKTKLSIIYPAPETPEAKEALLKSGMVEGWNSSLNKLEKALQ